MFFLPPLSPLDIRVHILLFSDPTICTRCHRLTIVAPQISEQHFSITFTSIQGRDRVSAMRQLRCHTKKDLALC